MKERFGAIVIVIGIVLLFGTAGSADVTPLEARHIIQLVEAAALVVLGASLVGKDMK